MAENSIRQEISDNLKSIKSDDVYDLIPMGFPEFVMNISAILLNGAHRLLQTDFYDVTFPGEDKFSGKAKSKPNVKDYISVLNGNDFLRHSNLFTQFWPFMSWLLKEEPPKFDEDDETMWYSLSFLAEKWNEFARIENERINGKSNGMKSSR